MVNREFFIMQQEAPATTKSWWVSCMTIDEERESVTHRLIYGPFETKAEAEAVLEAARG
jgi:hypothetical protein